MLITIFSLIILFFSIVLHEIAHGYVAYKLGDPTAKYAGRLSLNPLVHLDPIGSFLFPLFTLILTLGRGVKIPIVGWAKPVPINPYNFSDQKWGELKVAIAGPATNFLIALICGLFIRFIFLPNLFLEIFSFICIYNIFWGIFNLVPVPPLDGSHILFSLLQDKGQEFRLMMQQYGILLLFFLLFFGLELIEPLVAKIFFLITNQPFTF